MARIKLRNTKIVYVTNKERRELQAIPVQPLNELWNEVLIMRLGKIENTNELSKREYVDCIRIILDKYYH